MLRYITRSIRLPILALLLLAMPAASFAGIFISITVAPPPLPVYVQPACLQAGYMWAPGYWAWGDEGYFWVPGTWVAAPSVGMLWTPGYWGWANGLYAWNGGYWGPHVGFYGGVNYGFGYGGVGFVGGEWRGGGFFYNSAVMNVSSSRITNVYVNKTVIVNNTTVNNVSYNGGAGGTTSRATAAEQTAAREPHVQPTSAQAQQETGASHNTQLLAKNNGGKPAIAATAKSGDFSPTSAVPAKAAGGRVEPATLNASAKSMPPAAKTAATSTRPPSAVGGPNTPAAVAHPQVNDRPNAASGIPKSQPQVHSTAPQTETRRPTPASTPPPKTAAAPKTVTTPKPAPKPPSTAAHGAKPPKPPDKKDNDKDKK